MGFLSAFQQAKPASAHPSLATVMALIDSHLSALDEHAAPLRSELAISLIARAPSSPVVEALAARAGELARFGARLRVVFAKPAPADALQAFVRAAAPLCGEAAAGESIRWVPNPALHNAHEQLTLGASRCWSGDSMRRAVEQRNVMELVEQDAPNAVRLAQLAFSAMWSAARPLPAGVLKGDSRGLDAVLAPMALRAREQLQVSSGGGTGRGGITRH